MLYIAFKLHPQPLFDIPQVMDSQQIARAQNSSNAAVVLDQPMLARLILDSLEPRPDMHLGFPGTNVTAYRPHSADSRSPHSFVLAALAATHASRLDS